MNTPDQWLLETQSLEGGFDGTASATGQALQGLSSRALPIHLRPVVVSTGLEKREEVGRNSAFHAILNTALDPSSVATTTFTLLGPGGPVASIVSYSGRTATLTPKVLLQGSAKYRLTVDGFRGMRRRAMGPAYHWDVTTVPYWAFLPLVSR